MPRLIDIIASFDEIDPEDVIFAKPEWSCDTESAIFRLTDDYRVPEEALRSGFRYLLDVDVARQVMVEFKDRPDATLEEKCNRIIQYAIYDA